MSEIATLTLVADFAVKFAVLVLAADVLTRRMTRAAATAAHAV